MADEEKLSEQQIADLLKKIGPMKEPPADMAARVKASVRETWIEETSSTGPAWGYRIAAVVAALSIGLLLTLQTPNEVSPMASIDTGRESIQLQSEDGAWNKVTSDSLFAGSVIRVAGEQPASITFAQGMNVRLKPGALVTLPNDHEIELGQGSIYLDSYELLAENSQANPADGHLADIMDSPPLFTVLTPFGSASDIGTQFMVSLDSEQAWSVQVRDGIVNVADNDQSLSLTPGDLVTITANDELTRSTVPAHDDSWKWSEKARPAYDIEGRNLNDYLMWVSRETGRELRYQSDSARVSATRTRIHGTIDGLTPTDSLKHVLEITDLKLIDGSGNAIIVDLSR